MIGAKLLRSQAGDTIVEVLIAITVVSLVLSASYATTIHNAARLQATQEHTIAAKLLENQLEFLHTDSSKLSGHKCFDATGNGVDDPNCTVKSDGTLAGTHDQPQFTLTVTPPPAGSTTYNVNVSWEAPGSSTPDGKDHITMYYRTQ